MFLAFLLNQAKSYNQILLKEPKKSRRIFYPIANAAKPYSIVFPKVENLERDYSTGDLNSIVDQISNEFNLERH